MPIDLAENVKWREVEIFTCSSCTQKQKIRDLPKESSYLLCLELFPMTLLGSNEFIKCHLSNTRSLIENSKFKGSLTSFSGGQKERPDHIRQKVSMRVLSKCTKLATDSLRIHTLKELHHITPLVHIIVTVQLTRIPLTISSNVNDSLMVEQAMHNGVSNYELCGIAHSKITINQSIICCSSLRTPQLKCEPSIVLPTLRRWCRRSALSLVAGSCGSIRNVQVRGGSRDRLWSNSHQFLLWFSLPC